jgi:exopolyphosphatase / guanosine-5'-triphosphate,3'-diphosphate pyrophosphatase
VRVGVVDLGTNSTRLLVADVSDGQVVEVERRVEITHLGESVDAGRRLLPAATARVCRCLDGYRRELIRLEAERAVAIGTSALRDAENGAEFLDEVAHRYGLQTLLVSGIEEAELTLLGVATDGPLTEDTLVIDIGGGSTELTLGGEKGANFSTSLQLGCVRLTERFLASDPPTTRELASLAARVRDELPEIHPVHAIGVSGTVTTLAALDLELVEYDPVRVHRHVVSRDSVARQLGRLAALTTAQRARIPMMEPGRAPVIVAGAEILFEVLSAYDLTEIETSERDLLHGAALAAAAPD